MANLIYVYTTDKLPTKPNEDHKEVGAQLLYSARYAPTIMTDIFVGSKYIKQVYSLEFIETMAAASDFIEAIKLFTSLLPALTQVAELDKDMLRDAAEVIKKKKGKFLITDFSETSMMFKKKLDDILKLNINYIKEAISNANKLKIISRISNFDKQVKILDKHLVKSKRFDLDDLGIGRFSE